MINYKVKFITNSLEKEATYICYLAKDLVHKNFQNNGFTVLPFADPENLYSVYFPDLAYTKIFWQVASTHSANYGQPYPEVIVSGLKELLTNSQNDLITNRQKSDYIAQWKKIEKQALTRLFSNLIPPSQLKVITINVEVLLTKYGTRGAFYSTNGYNAIDIFCTARLDLPVVELIRTLVLAVYQAMIDAKGEVGSLAYNQWMAFADYSVIFTPIGDYTKSQPRISSQQGSSDIKIYRDSLVFLTKLGLLSDDTFSLSGQEIKLGKNCLNSLTPQEKQLLRELIVSRGRVISFERTGEVIWGRDKYDKFSLYALAKVIENIRSKLREAGVNTNPIKTIRKQGYMFIS